MELIALAILVLAAVVLFREAIHRFLGELGQGLAVAIPLSLVWVWFSGAWSATAVVAIAALSIGLVKLSHYITARQPRAQSRAEQLRMDYERGVITDQQFEDAMKAINQ